MDIIKRYQDLPSARHNKNRIVQVLDRNGVLYKSDGEFWSPLDQDASAAWGNINGTIANQTDLANALAGKVGFVQDPVTGKVKKLEAAGASIVPMQAHPNLWCDLSVANVCADDLSIRDNSGNNRDAARGVGLPAATLHGTAGYFSTAKGSGSTQDTLDTILHLPSINLDYDGGEAALIVLLFKKPAPAADESIIGNAASSSTSGWRIRARATGYCDVGLYSTTGGVASLSGNSTTVLADGKLHQLAILIDGKSKTRSFWEDGVLTRNKVAALASCDTRESAGLHIGGVQLAPSGATNTSAISFRRITIMRWGASESLPENDDLTRLVKRLRSDLANPPRVFEV